MGGHPDFGGLKPLGSYVGAPYQLELFPGTPYGGTLSMGIRGGSAGGSAGDPRGIRSGFRGSVQFWKAFGPRFGGIHPRQLRAFIILKGGNELL